MKAYVEFEIQEGAYDISCPDALCPNQGILSISNEISALVTPELLERHKRFRLNRGKLCTITTAREFSQYEKFHFQKSNWIKIVRGVHEPAVRLYVLLDQHQPLARRAKWSKWQMLLHH